MRLKHRVKVVQSLEDAVLRNALRSVRKPVDFCEDDLKDLFWLVRGDHLWQLAIGSYTGTQSVDDHNQGALRVDLEQFRSTFMAFSPWANNGNPSLNDLVDRIFKVIFNLIIFVRKMLNIAFSFSFLMPLGMGTSLSTTLYT